MGDGLNNTHTTDTARAAKAEATLKRREEQARDGAKAMNEYLAAQAATRAKTERLKALRLAKEAEEMLAPAPAKPRTKVTKN